MKATQDINKPIHKFSNDSLEISNMNTNKTNPVVKLIYKEPLNLLEIPNKKLKIGVNNTNSENTIIRLSHLIALILLENKYMQILADINQLNFIPPKEIH